MQIAKIYLFVLHAICNIIQISYIFEALIQGTDGDVQQRFALPVEVRRNCQYEMFFQYVSLFFRVCIAGRVTAEQPDLFAICNRFAAPASGAADPRDRLAAPIGQTDGAIPTGVVNTNIL